jgi:ABC-type sugar transport system permease subunit
MAALIIMGVWKTFGKHGSFSLPVSGNSEHYYEAAEIDGQAMGKIPKITLPLLA